MKKTIKVDELKKQINGYLALDTVTQSEKLAYCNLISQVLHSTGNYKGFHYLFNWNGLSTEDANKIQYNRKYL